MAAKAVTNLRTLRAEILAQITAHAETALAAASSPIRRTSIGGAEVELFSPLSAEDSAAGMSGTLDELLELHDAAKTSLIAEGTAAPTDDEIKTRMRDSLPTVTGFTSDFTLLRYSA